MKTQLYFLLLLSLAATLNGCKKFDYIMHDPQVQFIGADRAELLDAFSGFTNDDPTACNLIYNPEEIPDVLCRIVKEARKGSEIVFLIDNSASMGDDIDQVKQNVNDIIDCLPKGCRLAAATYSDRWVDGLNWFQTTTLTEDYDQIRTFVNAIGLLDGGDYPESAFDALMRILVELPWRDCTAPDKIIVMTDALPHTDPAYTEFSLEQVLQQAESLCPNTGFYPVIVL